MFEERKKHLKTRLGPPNIQRVKGSQFSIDHIKIVMITFIVKKLTYNLWHDEDMESIWS